MRGYRVSACVIAAIAAALLVAGGSALGYAPTAISGTWVVSGGIGRRRDGQLRRRLRIDGVPRRELQLHRARATGSAAALRHVERHAQPGLAGDHRQRLRDRRRTGAAAGTSGATFSSIGTAHYDNLVHIKSDGTIDTTWQATANGPVYSLLVNSTTLYAGGGFTQADGRRGTTSRPSRPARARSSRASTRTSPGSFVWSMAVFGSNLYFGGSFDHGRRARRATTPPPSPSRTAASTTGTRTRNDTRLRASRRRRRHDLRRRRLLDSSAALRATASPVRRRRAARSTDWNPSPNGYVYSLSPSAALAGTDLRRRPVHRHRRPDTARPRRDRQLQRGNASSTWNPGLRQAPARSSTSSRRATQRLRRRLLPVGQRRRVVQGQPRRLQHRRAPAPSRSGTRSSAAASTGSR